MGPSRGNFWRSELSGRPVYAQIDAFSEQRRRQWLNMCSGIQATEASDNCEMRALHRNMELGNCLLA